MPKTDKRGRAKSSELPSTIRRSGKKAQRTFAKAHDAAAGQYGDGERAHRVAYAALKHTHEKVGDHWEKKAKKGRSDPSRRTTHGGVDANASKQHLYDLARDAGIKGRSKMTKKQLVEALQKSNERATARSARS